MMVSFKPAPPALPRQKIPVLLWVLHIVLSLRLGQGWLSPPTRFPVAWPSPRILSSVRMTTSLRNHDLHHWQGHPSVFPKGTPAGLRGEAVQSAIRSGRCVAWKLDEQAYGRVAPTSLDETSPRPFPLIQGMVAISGNGVRTFLHNLFTASFVPITDNASQPPVGTNASTQPISWKGSFQEACMLTARGQVIDRLGIACIDYSPIHTTGTTTMAWLCPSPGHPAQSLRSRLEKFVFPMDEIVVYSLSSDEVCIWSLSSLDKDDIQYIWTQYLWPQWKESVVPSSESFRSSPPILPEKDSSLFIPTPSSSSTKTNATNKTNTLSDITEMDGLVIMPTNSLPSNSCIGFTFAFLGSTASKVGRKLWKTIIESDIISGRTSSDNLRYSETNGPPIIIGPLEYETLRIQTGQPGFGYEMTAALIKSDKKVKLKTATDVPSPENTQPRRGTTPASPLELHLQRTLDFQKGCYLGQEGVASVLKNPRGPPRILYQVVFEDEFNSYFETDEMDSSDPGTNDINPMRLPSIGDDLFVLGSNEKIHVGTITSLAEPGSTGSTETVSLALIGRADSITKQMQSMNIEFAHDSTMADNDNVKGPIYLPAPDPLDGLEVIVGGSYTVGKLRSIPTRRLREGQLYFATDEDNARLISEHQSAMHTSLTGSTDDDSKAQEAPVVDESDAIIDEALADAAKALADKARKSEKMEQLRIKAKAALARRKQKKVQSEE